MGIGFIIIIRLNVVSLGDKPYKNPEYCEGFYKSGGLIAGST